MTLVRESLVEVGITSWSPPLAFSAKLALKGRLGDAAALSASGWAAIDTMLDAEIVGKSDVLKERALRRRASRVVSALGALAAEAARQEDDAVAAATRAARDVSQAAARLDRDADASAERLEEVLTPAGAAWQKEIDLVVTGRDARTTVDDPLFARYRTERALVLLAPPLADAMAGLAASSSVTSHDLAPVARALVRAYVARPGPAPMSLLARAGAAALVDDLGGFRGLHAAARSHGGARARADGHRRGAARRVTPPRGGRPRRGDRVHPDASVLVIERLPVLRPSPTRDEGREAVRRVLRGRHHDHRGRRAAAPPLRARPRGAPWRERPPPLRGTGAARAA